jgi:hypothetical protein
LILPVSDSFSFGKPFPLKSLQHFVTCDHLPITADILTAAIPTNQGARLKMRLPMVYSILDVGKVVVTSLQVQRKVASESVRTYNEQ